jgi:glycosidase
MAEITSIDQIDLSPKSGKNYWENCHREWREEFIYFVLVDRFQDDLDRNPITRTERSPGFGTSDQLSDFCGGTIKGILNHLDYIQGLGCTALWLSPIFKNSPKTYHGYSIENYLLIDPRFGTKEEMEQLVDEAHKRDMRVFLDITLNHSADTWSYLGDYHYYYYNGIRYPFGEWRSEDMPLPTEIRNPEYYTRMGEIRNWDTFPETQDGDFFGFKNFLKDESEKGLALQDILIKIHCYWIRELDIDGFRLDAVKHMGEMPVARFCSHIREYAYSLNKKNFFLFGELVGGDEAFNSYLGPKTSVAVGDKNIYYGLNSILDFPLYYVLADVIRGVASPSKLIERYQMLHESSQNRGEFGEFLVTFLDNHDQVGGSYKKRLGVDATDQQIIAGIGFILCALGTPCIYYGTEQGFDGQGNGDQFVREAMFSLEDKTTNVLNPSSFIYKEISKIAQIRKDNPILKFGRMFMREISENGTTFHLPHSNNSMLAFARTLSEEEILVVYNTSEKEERTALVLLGHNLRASKETMKFLYGRDGEIPIEKMESNGTEIKFIRLKLFPMEFVLFT